MPAENTAMTHGCTATYNNDAVTTKTHHNENGDDSKPKTPFLSFLMFFFFKVSLRKNTRRSN